MMRIKTRFAFFAVFFSLLLLNSCGSSDSAEQPSNEVSTPQDQAATFSEELNDEKEKENADSNTSNDEDNPLLEDQAFKRLAAFLPAKTNGVEAGITEGWLKGKDGTGFTFVKRSYKNPEDKSRLDLGIADAGNATLESLNLIKYWSNKKIDKTTGKGHEKTLTYNSFPAFEICTGGGCDLYVALDDRFLLSAYVNNKVKLDDRFSVFDQIDIKQLQQLPR